MFSGGPERDQWHKMRYNEDETTSLIKYFSMLDILSVIWLQKDHL